MKTVKVENPNVGDYICVYLEHGWIQIKRESEAVVIDIFDHKDELFTTECIFADDLAPSSDDKELQ